MHCWQLLLIRFARLLTPADAHALLPTNFGLHQTTWPLQTHLPVNLHACRQSLTHCCNCWQHAHAAHMPMLCGKTTVHRICSVVNACKCPCFVANLFRTEPLQTHLPVWKLQRVEFARLPAKPYGPMQLLATCPRCAYAHAVLETF